MNNDINATKIKIVNEIAQAEAKKERLGLKTIIFDKNN